MYLHVLYVLYVLHVFYVFYVLVCVLTCMRIYTRRRHSSITCIYIYIHICVFMLYTCVLHLDIAWYCINIDVYHISILFR